MKKIFLICGFILGVTVLLPAIITLCISLVIPTSYKQYEEKKQNEVSKSQYKQIKIIDLKTNKITNMDLEEYIKGVVSAEMPVSFEQEALKAQAVAARTYAIRKLSLGKKDESLKGADMSTDFNMGQAFIEKEKLKERWGKNFDSKYKKIEKAVDSTKGQIMIYKEEPIEAVFHSTSAGFTQDAKDVWSKDIPYLKSVDSKEDEMAPGFISTKTVSKKEFFDKLKSVYNDLEYDNKKILAQIKSVEKTKAGYVKNIQINNKLLKGRDIRSVFGLKSNNFEIKEEKDNIVFTTKGYGHGAGMSQYGANFMAQAGKDYKQILQHYYLGIKIKPINF